MPFKKCSVCKQACVPYLYLGCNFCRGNYCIKHISSHTDITCSKCNKKVCTMLSADEKTCPLCSGLESRLEEAKYYKNLPEIDDDINAFVKRTGWAKNKVKGSDNTIEPDYGPDDEIIYDNGELNGELNDELGDNIEDELGGDIEDEIINDNIDDKDDEIINDEIINDEITINNTTNYPAL